LLFSYRQLSVISYQLSVISYQLSKQSEIGAHLFCGFTFQIYFAASFQILRGVQNLFCGGVQNLFCGECKIYFANIMFNTYDALCSV